MRTTEPEERPTMAVVHTHVLTVGDSVYHLPNVAYWINDGADSLVRFIGATDAPVKIAKTTFEAAMNAYLAAL